MGIREYLLKMETKQCSKCKKVRPKNKFYSHSQTKDGLKSNCSYCEIKRHKKYFQKNKEKIYKTQRKWKENNPKKHKQNCQRYKDNNKEKMMEYDRVWKHKKYQTDDLFKLKCVVRSRIRAAMNGINEESTIEHLGCDIKFYKKYLTNLFSEEMSWDNYGTYWEIDHTIPLSRGGSFHYTNTTPMKVLENRKKSNKLL
jgi:hypothetical protein